MPLVGSQVKVRVGGTWLIANIRSLRLDAASEKVLAQIDFLGEGDEEKLTGKLYKFRRGVTRYPTPGSSVFPVSTSDLRQIYAADDRAHVEIGTVFPTKDIRAALYVDALLGKHFAILGSTGQVVSGLAFLLWAFGTWWIPLLLFFAVWRHLVRGAPVSYEPTLWSMVFPLGMYAAATAAYGRARGLGFMVDIARVEVWAGFAAWLSVAVAMGAALLRPPAAAPEVGGR